MSSQDIPIFPLPSVLFPGGYLPLRIFEQRYIDIIRDCSIKGSCFGVCLVNNSEDNNRPATHQRIGTTAEIRDFSTLENGLLGIVAQGVQRFFIQQTRMRDNGLLMAEVNVLDESMTMDIPEKFSVLSLIAQRFMEQVSENYPLFQPADLQNANWVGYRLSELRISGNRIRCGGSPFFLWASPPAAAIQPA